MSGLLVVPSIPLAYLDQLTFFYRSLSLFPWSGTHIFSKQLKRMFMTPFLLLNFES